MSTEEGKPKYCKEVYKVLFIYQYMLHYPNELEKVAIKVQKIIDRKVEIALRKQLKQLGKSNGTTNNPHNK